MIMKLKSHLYGKTSASVSETLNLRKVRVIFSDISRADFSA